MRGKRRCAPTMMWTFETLWPAGEWTQSGNRFATHELACAAMLEWVRTCAENDAYPAVRLVRVWK